MKFKWRRLIGVNISISVSEPWDISRFFNEIKLQGVIVNIKDQYILIRLNQRIHVNNCNFQFLIAAPRYKEDSIYDILNHKIIIDMIALRKEDENYNDPFQCVSKYRGGCEYTGSIIKLNNQKIRITKNEFQQIAMQQEEWNLKNKIQKARNIAEVSWNKSNFKELISAYESIRNYLTPIEIQKLKYAIKKSRERQKS